MHFSEECGVVAANCVFDAKAQLFVFCGFHGLSFISHVGRHQPNPFKQSPTYRPDYSPPNHSLRELFCDIFIMRASLQYRTCFAVKLTVVAIHNPAFTLAIAGSCILSAVWTSCSPFVHVHSSITASSLRCHSECSLAIWRVMIAPLGSEQTGRPC